MSSSASEAASLRAELARARAARAHYHLPCDTVDNVDRDVLLAMARATARALRRLGYAK